MQNNIRILCTRPLNNQFIEEAVKKNIQIDISCFIETEMIESVEVQQEIAAVMDADATVVFTSMNAVEAVAENIIDEQPRWFVYCIGNTTKELVQNYFPASVIAGTADDAASLAELIAAESQAEEILFFCGDQRRNELPSILKQHDIAVNEIVVYQTITLPHKISNDYRGILFFSPSAVECFFIKNKATRENIFFAIGNTTATAIKKYTTNPVIIADAPGKENLYEKMIEYFT